MEDAALSGAWNGPVTAGAPPVLETYVDAARSGSEDCAARREPSPVPASRDEHEDSTAGVAVRLPGSD
jgi:hypothetical protein